MQLCVPNYRLRDLPAAKIRGDCWASNTERHSSSRAFFLLYRAGPINLKNTANLAVGIENKYFLKIRNVIVNSCIFAVDHYYERGKQDNKFIFNPSSWISVISWRELFGPIHGAKHASYEGVVPKEEIRKWSVI